MRDEAWDAEASGSSVLAQARAAKAAGRGAKLLIAASILGGLLYGLGSSPLFRIERVRIRCADRLAAVDAARAVRLVPGETTVTVRTHRLRERLVACPRVRDAVVTRRFPHTLEIAVEPREAAAALVMPGGCMLADRDGVCISEAPEPPADLPCIRGIPVTGVRPGDRVVGPRMRAALECVQWAGRLGALGRVTVDVSTMEHVRVWTASGTPCLLGHAKDLGVKMASVAATVEFLRGRDVRARFVDVRDPDGPIVWEPARPVSASS